MGMTIIMHADGGRIFLDASVPGGKDETYSHVMFCAVCAPQDARIHAALGITHICPY